MADEALMIQRLSEDDAEAIGALSWAVFWRFVRPLYTQRAVFAFREFCREDAVRYRFGRGHEFFGALVEGDLLVGVLELKRRPHLSMIFIHESHQERGIGRALVEVATEVVRARTPDAPRLTVNASPNSLGFYRHLGFVADDETVREQKGVCYVPMYKDLA